MSQVYTELPPHFQVKNVPLREEPRRVLLCSPDYFEVVDVKNVYMEGQQGAINKNLAVAQWNELRNAYLRLKQWGMLDDVDVLPGEPALEDMVFCANQSFPWVMPSGEKVVIMSKMRHESRQREVIFFEDWYKAQGYRILHLQHTEMFEGMGDCIPHPGRRLLYGGYGHRSNPDAYNEVSELLDVPVLTLQLRDERFYHLDTCFVPLDEDTVMLCEEAFTPQGLAQLRQCFSNLIAIPAQEAAATFSLNAHVLTDSWTGTRTALLQPGGNATNAALEQTGYKVVWVETGEFMKSGGSVFCMKMMVY